jgi:hypothetical protein
MAAARCVTHHLHERGRPNRHPPPANTFSTFPVETAGPVRSWFSNPAEDRGRNERTGMMTATYTFDIFSSLDGYGSHSGDWGGYWG